MIYTPFEVGLLTLGLDWVYQCMLMYGVFDFSYCYIVFYLMAKESEID